MSLIDDTLRAGTKTTLSSIPEGSDGYVLAEFFKHPGTTDILHIARNDTRMQQIADTAAFFAPDVKILTLPAWDCLPYDRTSPNHAIISKRLDTLSSLATHRQEKNRPKRLVVTTVNALLQRLPPWESVNASVFHAKMGTAINRNHLTDYLVRHGYTRTGTATEPGEFAVRGSIMDIVASGFEEGVRLDFFGDTLDCIRLFDPLTQISSGTLESLVLKPASEVPSDDASIQRFRQNYRTMFGAVSKEDPFYEAISEGRKYPGMEHWLPLFYERLDTLFDYLPGATVTTDHLVDEARDERLATIQDHYLNRKNLDTSKFDDSAPYHPVPVESLYLSKDVWETLSGQHKIVHFCPFSLPEANGVIDAKYKQARNLATESAALKQPAFTLLKDYIKEQRAAGKGKNVRTLLACYSEGSRERLQHMLSDYDIHTMMTNSWADAETLSGKTVGLMVLPLEEGFTTGDYLFLSEQDLLGERIIRRAARKKKVENFLSEAASLTHGELVVHKEHGIGRFEGLETLTVSGEKHDCLRIIYDGGDKLYVPVENIELVTRYGGETEGVKLDKLGGASWQSRKARLKERIKLAAEKLMQLAAERELKKAPALVPLKGLYEEFCARFPYAETEDQLRAIEDVKQDLGSGKPMDRLICGDVGFGKTEVALRAAFMAVGSESDHGTNIRSGIQVALVAPTTLLCRQHYQTFKKRFEGFPVRIRQLSRMVTSAEARETRESLKNGEVDIIVGTHALLAKTISFKNLGLLIIDEEQHFGVAQKERLKELRADVHVLTLSATPIPRTLQMSLAGIKELSLIATPPVDRLAVRTFVLPFDPVVLREAILREHYRGGRTFYVCPRIKDLTEVEHKLKALVPEVKIVTAHGQMPATELDGIMNAFYEGKFDILLSTTIVESGLDIPSANTLVIHRSDNFGLAQLYQLRGRVGRGKTRAYAYLTLQPKRMLTKDATKRLEVMQKLDTLGAGFTLASHDMDIRGFGNLVGEEQSGHIREVGIELYQEMLREAVLSLKTHAAAVPQEDDSGWSPQINLGLAVLIPEQYVNDLSARMGLYRRLAMLETEEEVESFAAELIDRFGPLPQEVAHLLAIVKIKLVCRRGGIEKVDTGPKGAVISFRNNSFAKPEALLQYIAKNHKTTKLRADHKLVMMEEWASPEERIEAVQRTLHTLVGLSS